MKNKKILVIVHAFTFLLIVLLVIAFIDSRRQVGQLNSGTEPSETAVPDGTLPLGEPIDVTPPESTQTIQPSASAGQPGSTAAQTTASPNPTASATVRPTDQPTAKPTASPTALPSVKPTQTSAFTPIPTSTSTSTPIPTPTPTPTPTAKPTPTPTPRPTPTPTPRPTPTPSPTEDPNAFTYSVSTEQGSAPLGQIFVWVSVSPVGNYDVSYDGSSMGESHGNYYIRTVVLEDGNYASHVSVSKR